MGSGFDRRLPVLSRQWAGDRQAGNRVVRVMGLWPRVRSGADELQAATGSSSHTA